MKRTLVHTHRLRNNLKDRISDKNIKTVIANIFCVFKKVKEDISRDKEAIINSYQTPRVVKCDI